MFSLRPTSKAYLLSQTYIILNFSKQHTEFPLHRLLVFEG